MAIRYQGEMAIVSVDATDYLGTFAAITVEYSDIVIESSPLTLMYEHEQVAASSVKFTIPIKKAHGSSSNDFSCNLDVTALTIGTHAHAAYCKSGSFDMSTTTKDTRGMGERWVKPKIVKKKIEMSLSLMLDGITNASEAKAILMASGTLTDKNVAVSATLDGTAYSFPGLMKAGSIKINQADLQMLDLTVGGRSYADSPLANFPTTPTGTSSIAAKALNATAAVAFEFESATDGINLAGNAVITGLKISWGEDQLITAEYILESYGTVTTTRAT